MRIITGQPVSGDDFFDRIEEVDLAWTALREGNNLLIPAPRRVGKTSLAYAVGDQAMLNDWTFVFVDAQGDRDELALLENLVQRLKEKGVKLPALAKVSEAVRWLRRHFEGKYEGAGFGLEIPQDQGKDTTSLEHLIEGLFREMEQGNVQYLIAIDELPVLLGKIDSSTEGLPASLSRLKSFLDWFRRIRVGYKTRIRWLLLGSVGLDTFVEERNLTPKINDLTTQSLGAFSIPVAGEWLSLAAKAYGLVVSDEVRDEILKEIGWPLPYYLQVVFEQLLRVLGKPRRNPAVSDVRSTMAQLDRPEHYSKFETWRGRLREGLTAEQHKTARAILNQLCAVPQGLPRTSLISIVAGKFPEKDGDETERLVSTALGRLERDGYLLRADQAEGKPALYAFRSFLLRRYWYNREVA